MAAANVVDQHGQVIDVLVWDRRNNDATRRFFQRALATLKVKPPRSSPAPRRSTQAFWTS